MPSRKSRNANRQPVNHTYPTSFFHEFDSPGPSNPVLDIPAIDSGRIPNSDTEPLAEPIGEQDLIDMHDNVGEAVGDLSTSNSLAPTSLPEFPVNVAQEMNLGDQHDAGHIRSPVLARYVDRLLISPCPCAFPAPLNLPSEVKGSMYHLHVWRLHCVHRLSVCGRLNEDLCAS